MCKFIRPRLSVWSHPHRFGTLSSHLLWTFMSHATSSDHDRLSIVARHSLARLLCSQTGNLDFSFFLFLFSFRSFFLFFLSFLFHFLFLFFSFLFFFFFLFSTFSWRLCLKIISVRAAGCRTGGATRFFTRLTRYRNCSCRPSLSLFLVSPRFDSHLARGNVYARATRNVARASLLCREHVFPHRFHSFFPRKWKNDDSERAIAAAVESAHARNSTNNRRYRSSCSVDGCSCSDRNMYGGKFARITRKLSTEYHRERVKRNATARKIDRSIIGPVILTARTGVYEYKLTFDRWTQVIINYHRVFVVYAIRIDRYR